LNHNQFLNLLQPGVGRKAATIAADMMNAVADAVANAMADEVADAVAEAVTDAIVKITSIT